MEGQRVTKPRDTRRRHTEEFKRALVERSLVPGASVAAIAQDVGINANLLFNWRRLHLQSMACASDQKSGTPALLPVTVVESTPTSTAPTAVIQPPAPAARSPAGSIEINIRGAVVRVRGNVDEASLRTVLRALVSAA